MPKKLSHTAKLNTTPGSCVDCPIEINRRVSYLFRTGLWDKVLPSEKTLKIPFAYAVNGKVNADFAKATGIIHAYQAKDNIFVEPGQTVSLYLNSDAAPANRKNPVFAITPKDHDVEVVIHEKRGKLGSDDTPKFKETKEITGKSGVKRKVDVYEATLTGDIWLKVSHKFTLDEAKALTPVDAAPEIRAAVLKLYDGSQHGILSISMKNADGKAQVVDLSFEDAANPRENVTSFDMNKDGLPRVHPRAWVALIEAAFKAGVTKVQTSSAWRPQLGSILHRSGLGLDVSYLDKTPLDRGELIKDGPDTANVSEEEKKLYKEKEAAEAEARKAAVDLKKLESERDALLALKKTAPNKASPIREMELEKEIPVAVAKVKDADKKSKTADQAWNDERDKNEPVAVKTFRKQLSTAKYVKSIFDPWFMDGDTHDAKPAKPNVLKDGNEKLHRNHLHVTIDDPTLPLK